MKTTISGLIGLLPVVGPVIAAAPQFKAIYDDLKSMLDSDADQELAQAAYEKMISDEIDSHHEFQKMLEEAAQR